MTTWSKVMGGGNWPMYFDRGTITPRFARLCIQPLQRGYGKALIDSFHKALFESLPGAAVSGARVRLKSALILDPARESLILGQVIASLRELRLTSAAKFPLLGTARASGPSMLQSTDLNFTVPVKLLIEPFVLAKLHAGETLELDFVVHWGRGLISGEKSTDIELPLGWTRISRRHSPVLHANLSTTVIEVGPHTGSEQLIAEITTDGSLEPEDAFRRAGQYVRHTARSIAS